MNNVWLQVFRSEMKRVVRNSFLLMMATYLPAMALVMRWAVPELAIVAKKYFDLTHYYPLIAITFTFILPFIFGCVLGLQMLEEKDERSLIAVAVTPFSTNRYFFFRVVIYAIFSGIMAVVTHIALGLITNISLLHLVVLGLVFSVNVAISSLVIAILAKNQVQGFAVLKGSGLLFTGPALSFFLTPHWDLCFGIIPFFWPIKAYFLACAGSVGNYFWLAIAVGFVTQAIAIWLLYRFFTRKILQV